MPAEPIHNTLHTLLPSHDAVSDLPSDLLRQALDSARDSIHIKDRNLRYVYVNPCYCRIWGGSPSDFLGRTTGEVFWMHESTTEEIDRQVLLGATVENDSLWPNPDGERYYRTTRSPIRGEEGEILGILIIARDVSELLKSQNDLRISEERFRAVVESVQDCIWIKNKSLVFTHVNPAYVRLWGANSASDFVGKTREEAFHEKNEHVDDVDRRVLQGETVEEDVHFPTSLWDFNFRDTRLPLKNDKGEIIGLCGVRRDMTDHVRAQDTQRRASRFEAAITSARGIAHDFSNLMTIILGNIGLLQMDFEDDTQATAKLDAIRQTAQRARDMAEQMLTLAHGGEIAEMRRVNVQSVMDEMMGAFGHAIPKALNLEVNVNADLWDVRGDGSQIARIFFNLGKNAVEAMNGKGLLRIFVDNSVAERDWSDRYPGLVVGNRYVHICFEDSGCGMDEVVRDKMFDPFFSTKAKGRGFGLSSVFAIVQAHGGHIFCRSQPGRGTVFDLFLPAAESDEIAVGDAASSHGGNDGAFLVVEESENERTQFVRLLKSMGYAALSASSLANALSLSELEGQNPVAILVDFSQGENEMHLDSLRAKWPGIRIIASSPFTGTGQVRPLPKQAVHGFIHKPPQRRGFAEALQRVLGAAR